MTLAEFKAGAIAINPRHVNRTTDCCDWCVGGIEACHERAHFPWSPFKESTVKYWGSVTFTDLALAEREAAQFAGRVQMHFYCDEDSPAWFLIFDELENALAHAFKHLAA